MPNLKPLEPKRIVLIGSSTGGPGHLQKILSTLPLDYCATIIIAQHLAKDFIPSFIKQLSQVSQLEVLAAQNNNKILSGKVYVCSDATQFQHEQNDLQFKINSTVNTRYNPDIDHLFLSAAVHLVNYKIMSIILTGIGDDGSKGIKELAVNGAMCIAESESSAVVYGMPFQAKRKVDKIIVEPLDAIIQSILKFGAK